MKKVFWQKIKEYKVFVILVVLIVLLVFFKLNPRDKITNNADTPTQTIKTENTITTTIISPTADTSTPTIKKLSDEEVSNLDYESYVKYAESWNIEEAKNLPPLALSVNEAFPYEEDSFWAEKFENLKVYAKAKIDDRAKAERDLKYWFYIEIGATLPSDKIVWE